jgi:hypothetical protein
MLLIVDGGQFVRFVVNVICEDENARNIGQGETPQGKHKRLKLGGGHLYDRSGV